VAAAALARDAHAGCAATVGAREAALTAAVLAGDAKNYHAWAHRGWAVAACGLWDDDVAFTQMLLKDDARNNSAWNARLCALTRRGAAAPLPADVASRELALVDASLTRAPRNESAWAYARALARAAAPGEAAAAAGAALAALAARAEAEGDPFASEVCADMDADVALAAAAAGDADAAAAAAAAATTRFGRLAVADPVRAHYWAFRAAEVREAAGAGGGR
jgi:protein farnesyltransferase/geranylgeranyltransferase type-1 subunit alpha